MVLGALLRITIAAFIVSLFLVASTAAVVCVRSWPRSPPDPRQHPDFLTPLARSREVDLDLYWLGESVQVESLRFEIVPGSEFIERGSGGPEFDLVYAADIAGGGSLTLHVDSFSESADRWRNSHAVVLGEEGAVARKLRVAKWDAELVVMPAGARPVNALVLFVLAESTVVRVDARAGATGVPGEDINPLIKEPVLLETIGRALELYPH